MSTKTGIDEYLAQTKTFTDSLRAFEGLNYLLQIACQTSSKTFAWFTDAAFSQGSRAVDAGKSRVKEGAIGMRVIDLRTNENMYQSETSTLEKLKKGMSL
jgi:hypothetical protein